MSDESELIVRATRPRDLDAVRAVHVAAFPEAERDRVAGLAVGLMQTPSEPASLSLMAVRDGRVIGHVVFSPVRLIGLEDRSGFILAPLAVDPETQSAGVGTALVRTGLEQLAAFGVEFVLVYGDPAYYGRFGFDAKAGQHFTAPHPLEYPFGWQALKLDSESAWPASPAQIACVCDLDDPALW